MSDSQYTEDSSIQAGQDVASTDNPSTDYESRQGQKDYIPVQSDSKDVEDPINPDTADSDETLAADEADAIDDSNIIDERTRGAKPEGSYQEPGDEEGLPSEDGTSAVSY